MRRYNFWRNPGVPDGFRKSQAIVTCKLCGKEFSFRDAIQLPGSHEAEGVYICPFCQSVMAIRFLMNGEPVSTFPAEPNVHYCAMASSERLAARCAEESGSEYVGMAVRRCLSGIQLVPNFLIEKERTMNGRPRLSVVWKSKMKRVFLTIDDPFNPRCRVYISDGYELYDLSEDPYRKWGWIGSALTWFTSDDEWL